MKIAGHDYTPGEVPSPALVRDARLAVGHSQTLAAATVFRDRYQTWQQWERGDHAMDAAVFLYYSLATGLISTDQLPRP